MIPSSGNTPKDWITARLGELGSFRKGKGIKKDEVKPDGRPCIRYGELYTHHHEHIKKIYSYIDEKTAKQSQKISKGDILFAGSGETKEEIGKCAAFLAEQETFAGGDVIIFTPRNSDSLFLGFLLNHESVARQKAQFGQGDAVVHIYPRNLREIIISLPRSKSEQTAIATALSDADALITALEKLVEKKRNIKQGVIQQLLRPNQGWKVRRLGEVTDINRGGSPRPIENYLTNDSNGVNWIKIGDVAKFAKFIFSTTEKIKPAGIAFSRYVKEGDFLLSNSMSFGRPYILKTSGCIHDGWLVIQNYQNTFNTDFLYYSLGFETTINQYKTLAAGSSVLNLNKHIVKKVVVSFPELPEQTRIAQVLSDIDAEIDQIQKKLEKHKQIKAGMMQQLLTGRTRLK